MSGEWIAQLPQDLRSNEAFTEFATLGDFAKAHLEEKGKLVESTGKLTTLEKEANDLKTKVADYIPKLTENATEEERNSYYTNLGRPKTEDEYELEQPKEGKMDEVFAKAVRGTFHKIGVSKSQAKELSGWWNEFATVTQAKYNEAMEAHRIAADTALRKDLGDKYDVTVKHVNDLVAKFSGTGADVSFLKTMKLVPIVDPAVDNPVGNDARLMRWMLGIAKLVGEDASPMGGPARQGKPDAGLSYPNSPKPPTQG